MFKTKRGLTIQLIYFGKESGYIVFKQNNNEVRIDGKSVKYSRISGYVDKIIEIINSWPYDHFDENITTEELRNSVEMFYSALDEATEKRRKNKELGIEEEKPDFIHTIVVVGDGIHDNKTYSFLDEYPENFKDITHILKNIRKHIETKNENADE